LILFRCRFVRWSLFCGCSFNFLRCWCLFCSRSFLFGSNLLGGRGLLLDSGSGGRFNIGHFDCLCEWVLNLPPLPLSRRRPLPPRRLLPKRKLLLQKRHQQRRKLKLHPQKRLQRTNLQRNNIK
jgi:hypothetical protein